MLYYNSPSISLILSKSQSSLKKFIPNVIFFLKQKLQKFKSLSQALVLDSIQGMIFQLMDHFYTWTQSISSFIIQICSQFHLGFMKIL